MSHFSNFLRLPEIERNVGSTCSVLYASQFTRFCCARIKLVRNSLTNMSRGLNYLLNHPQYLNTPYYEGRLQSSYIHLITPSRNFVEVR
jgi:hypothetical protein